MGTGARTVYPPRPTWKMIRKEECPELNATERKRLANRRWRGAVEQWKADLSAEQREAYDVERRAEAEANRAREAEEERRWSEYLERKQAWPGTGRVARWIENRLRKAGIEYRRSPDYLPAVGESVYFYLGDGRTIRVSDHPQPEWGGYKGRGAAGDERYGPADMSIDPWTGTDWREAV